LAVQDIETLARNLKHCTDDERLDLLAEIQQKENYLKVLNNFAVSVIGISNYEDLVWYVVKEVVAQLGFVDCVIYKFEPAENSLLQQAAIGEKSPKGRILVNPMRIPMGKGVTGRVAVSGKAMIVADLSAEANYVADIGPALSEICVPLLYDGELLGVIDCEDPRPNHFNEGHLEILSSVASMTSSKIKECEVVKKLADQAQVLSVVREAVVVTDLDGKILECNGGAEALYGYSRDELLGADVTKHSAADDAWRAGRPERLAQLDRDGEWRGPVKIQHASGKIITVDVSSTPLRDKAGKPVASISVGRDITALVEAEQKLRDKNETLQHKQLELEKALKESEAATAAGREKDTFLANTSHELRTPLAGVMGMIDLLNQTELSEDQRELISVAGKSANTLLFIINDILDLARIDAGKITLKKEHFDLVSTVRAAVESLRPDAEEKGLTYHVVLPKGISYHVNADPNRILQIIFNLVGNAIKFTDAGEIEIRLSFEEKGGSTTCEISVQDTGLGFSEDAASRIFERFEQVDGSSSKSTQGAGLGLAISNELAEMMGGSIEADSLVGEGSIFRFKAEFETVAAPNAEQEGGQNATIVSHDTIIDLNILVAEDNLVNQNLIGKLLKLFGWSATFVGNGREALRLLEQKNSFDLVLMDIRMPVMDGMEATKAIRALAGMTSQIPIIALTANALPSDEREYLGSGMNAVVAKPIDIHSLKNTVLTCAKQAFP